MKIVSNNLVIAWVAFSVLVILYASTVIENSINIPFSDDFHQQLSTVSALEKGHSKSYSLFRQHNVHRIFTTHIFTYLEHAIFGQVNLNNQLLIALVLLLALTLMLVSFSQIEHRPLMILMAAIFLLSPEAGATWVGGTTPYYALMLFGLVSIKTLFLIDQRRYLLISLGCLWLATYSMIGGVILPIVGIAYLTLSGKIKSLPGTVWAVASVAILAWYFKDFKSHGNQPSIFYFIEDPELAFDFTFKMLGNFFSDVIETDFLSTFTIAILIAFIYVVYAKNLLKKFCLSPEGLAFVFILLVIGSVVAGRIGFNDLNMAYADRYFAYTKTLWLLVFVFFLNNQLVSRDGKSFILGFAVLYMLATYQSETKSLEQHKQAQSIAMLDHLVRGDSSRFEFGDTRAAGRLVDNAMALGVYTPELRATKSRTVKYLKYSEFKDGLNISVVRDATVGRYRYFAFQVDTNTNVHEIAVVPREVYGPATLLKAAAKVDSSRLSGADLQAGEAAVYEVIIDTSKFDDSLTNDVFVISLGMITTMGTL